MDWLMYASAAVWVGLGLYVGFLASRQSGIENRLRRLERDHGQA